MLTILIFIISVTAVIAQDNKPEIVGQKTLVTNQGEPITVQLTDLYVEEEEPAQSGEDDNDGQHEPDDGDEGGDSSDGGGTGTGGEEQDGDADGGNSGDGEESDGKDDHDHHDDDKKPDDKHDNDDKGDQGHKGPKGPKGDKGHGNGRDGYPNGYMLLISDGSHYRRDGNTVIPEATFSGELIVGVRVKNDTYTSNKFDLKITVLAVNVPPVITGQSSLSTPEHTPIPISLNDLRVTDPDNQYPTGFTLRVLAGDHYAVEGDIVTPVTGFTGTLAVPVTVSDGQDDSEPFKLKIEVLEKQNVPPEVVGQVPLTVPANQSITIRLSDLTVRDPDSRYPEDFSLTLFQGEHYTVSHLTVRPEAGFSGDLRVGLSVNDGHSSSAAFNLKITVTPPPDVQPVITGQTALKVIEGECVEIAFSHLVVEDPDNDYPAGFSMTVGEGVNYSVSGRTVTPNDGFVGTLSVPIVVNDGKLASAPFDFRIEVVPAGHLEIVGQKVLEIPEDSSLMVHLSDLIVNDPDGVFPAGFSLQVLDGDNYDVDNGTLAPKRDFFGNLYVPVSVSRGDVASSIFQLLVIVTPVNDPPQLSNLEGELLLMEGTGPISLTSSIEVSDVDDDHLLWAEIVFEENYERGKDELTFQPVGNIRGVFEPDSGALFLFGRASTLEYQGALRSVQYNLTASPDSAGAGGSKSVVFKVDDGKATGNVARRLLLFQTGMDLEIPSAFTPNNDLANDTWKITSLNSDEPVRTVIRVYDRSGNVVFQTTGLDHEWDGIFNGAPLPADVYFYTIDLDLAYRKVQYKGVVSILR